MENDAGRQEDFKAVMTTNTDHFIPDPTGMCRPQQLYNEQL